MADSEIITQLFGNKLRVRVSGILIVDESILLVKHHFNKENPFFWTPPGGGMEFGESAETTLKREFYEETGLQVEPVRFLFVHEFLHDPLHAIELFFEVKLIGGELINGHDPEMHEHHQIIEQVAFLSFTSIQSMELKSLHQLFSIAQNAKEILSLEGYFKL